MIDPPGLTVATLAPNVMWRSAERGASRLDWAVSFAALGSSGVDAAMEATLSIAPVSMTVATMCRVAQGPLATAPVAGPPTAHGPVPGAEAPPASSDT